MAKISPVSIKYIISARFESEGTVEKPDVIGALFGQTEGLLGADLELRELQKEGKIGRIDVELKSENSKTIGDIQIPSSLGKEETTIIAASLETIERIGPSDAKIEILKIEDVRGNKRDYIVERAKKLLEGIEGTSNTREIAEAVKTSSKMSKLTEYGPESLPAGDLSKDELIIVEGRADVLSLLRANVNNVIGMNGTILPESVKELSFGKEVTLFVDGDRGGILIGKNTINNARVDYVSFAPDGKEVEELTPKEILGSLRKRMTAKEFMEQYGESEDKLRGRRTYHSRSRDSRDNRSRDRDSRGRDDRDYDREEEEPVEMKKPEKLTKEEVEKLKPIIEDISGTHEAVLLNEKMEVIKQVPMSQLPALRFRGVYIMVIDGTATAPIVRFAERLHCMHLAATNFASTETYMDLVSL
jgi:DNA primase